MSDFSERDAGRAYDTDKMYDNPIIEQKEQENDENALYSEWFHENLDVNAENYADYLVKHYEEEFEPALSFEDWCMIEAERLKHRED